jgi:hypothetical protein
MYNKIIQRLICSDFLAILELLEWCVESPLFEKLIEAEEVSIY